MDIQTASEESNQTQFFSLFIVENRFTFVHMHQQKRLPALPDDIQFLDCDLDYYLEHVLDDVLHSDLGIF